MMIEIECGEYSPTLFHSQNKDRVIGKFDISFFRTLKSMLILAALLLSSFSVFSQKITILEAETGLPVAYAHIHFYCQDDVCKGEMSGDTTDKMGQASIPFQTSSLCIVSYLGFKTQSTYISGKEDITLHLEKSIYDLDQVVITAQFAPSRNEEALFKAQIITPEKVENSGSQNLAKALTTQGTFMTNNGHTNETSLNLGGLSGEHVKILIDGVPVEGRISGNVDLSQVLINDIERIEVVEGPVSVAYGSNALAGVVNIITKKTIENKFELKAKAFYESVGQYNFDGDIAFSNNKNTFKLSGGRNYFDGFALEDTSRFKDWKPREQYFGRFSFDRHIKHMHFTWTIDGFKEKMTNRGMRRAPYYVTAFDTHYNTQRFANKLMLQGRTMSKNNINVVLGQSYYQRVRNIYYRDLVNLNEVLSSGPSDQDTTEYWNYMARASYSTAQDSTWINALIGLDLKYDMIVSSRVIGHEQNIGDYAIFGGLNLTPTENLSIHPAARYSYNTRYSSPVLPSLNLLYTWKDYTKIRASWALGFRAPSLKELFIEFHQNSTINLWGNENLNAETSMYYQAGVDYHRTFNGHQIGLDANWQKNEIDGIIQLVNITEVDWQYMNVGEFSSHAVSLGASWSYNGIGFSAKAHPTWRKTNLNNWDIEDNYELNFISLATLSYEWSEKNTSFQTSYKYNGEMYSLYVNDEGEVSKSTLNPWSDLDASVSTKLNADKIQVTFGVKNILNVNQVPLDGRIYGVSSSKNDDFLLVNWGRTAFFSLMIKV